MLYYFKHSYFQKKNKNKRSVSPVTFHAKLERNIALMGTAKLCRFKCLLYDEDLIRRNFNYKPQLVTSNKVKIADMIHFNEDVF